MATIRKPYPKKAPDLQSHLQSQSRTALDKKLEGGRQTLCDPPEIYRRVDPLREASDQSTGAAKQRMNSDALENEWAAHQEVDPETLQEGWEANEKIASALAAPTSRIPAG